MSILSRAGLIAIFIGVNLIVLLFSLCLRLAGLQHGRFNLFNRCGRPQEGYTPLGIIFGRSLNRPLVRHDTMAIPILPRRTNYLFDRGESRVIGIIRLISLTGLCVAIPAFGIYALLVSPLQAYAMTRNIQVSQSWLDWRDLNSGMDSQLLNEQITIALFYTSYTKDTFNQTGSMWTSINPRTSASVTVGTGTHVCTTVSVSAFDPQVAANCPFNWFLAPPGSMFSVNSSSGIVLSANFTDPSGILYVKPGLGDPSDVNTETEAIPLAAGSHLSIVLSTNQRQIFSKGALDLLGWTAPLRTVSVQQALLVQADPSPPNADTVSLRLRPRLDVMAPTHIVQDDTDASVLTGVATFGGFWTFVNGTFALFFGANILYFLLKRRSLSALGLVHIFQRRDLTRKWHEDFPALHTEGGRPGSESAGIVAFLRERLVDLDDEYIPGDLEAQVSNNPHAESDANGPEEKEWERDVVTLEHSRPGSTSA
ncbi:hypothetical protein K438DRAFT_2051565 [Mycena galopus ATCC 62051]|nr:hypothetical protein K438DRAFT_2051565 [Mycena galopus ATCC 62051]